MVYCYLDRFVWILQENLKLNRNFMFHLTLFFSHASVDHQPTDWGKSKSPLSELWSVGKLIGEYYRCDASYKKATPTEALGFISNLPQLAWDKRLCCCCCISTNNESYFDFNAVTVFQFVLFYMFSSKSSMFSWLI